MTEKTTHSDYKVRLPWFGLPRLVPFLKPYKGIVICMALLMLLNGIIDICLPLFQQYAINNFIAKGTLSGLGRFITLYVCVIAVQIASSMIDAYQASQIEMYVGRDLKRASFNHLQTLSFSYFNQNSVGYIHARVMSDTNRIGSIVAWGLMDMEWNLSYLVGVVVVMFAINWRLALWVVALTPIITLIAAFFQSKLTVLNRRVREINSQITGNFNEGITGAKTTKTLVVEEKMEQDFGRTTEDMRKTSIRTARYRATFISIVMFTASFAMALVLWRGGTLAMTSETLMQIGTLSVFMNYALGLMEPIQTLVRMISELINVQVNIERFTNLLATRSDVEDSPEVVEKYGDTFQPKRENWEPLHGDVEFQDVSFKYPDGEEYILEHFNLKVPQGTNVAIVGETGAGKSTLVNLVCRFFEPTKGRVLIDGRDARERSQLWLHSHVGYVLQSPHLFSGTIRENIRYGRPEATDEEVYAAARAVSADRVAAKLEQGYDTDVGECGDKLSTGEKQLISFARAVIARPKIFVLDEATSSVDTETEMLIQKATHTLMQGTTSFVIAHRLSTIRQADVILVIDHGKIVEQGTHERLLKAGGAYAALYHTQLSRQE